MKNKFYDVTKNGDGVFSAQSGRLIDILNPTADMITIGDIATGLSNICRFGGQITGFYSVAQHSVLVSHLCPPKYAIYGLLHDASEAYIGDMIKPLKNILGAVYEDIEAKFMHAVCDRYELDFSKLINVKRADNDALKMEHDFLRYIDSVSYRDAFASYGYGSSGTWSPGRAHREFNNRFASLRGDI